jgi:hypothetical protein
MEEIVAREGMDWKRLQRYASKARDMHPDLARSVGTHKLYEILKQAARIGYQCGYETALQDGVGE